MLESIVTNQPKLSKEEYKPYHDALVDRLVVLQQEAKKACLLYTSDAADEL